MDRGEAISKLIQASPILTAIATELSFTKAAERLGVDQSAVSHRVKALEDALGHTLFDRTTRALRLTEIGETLCHAAIDNMASWDTALDKVERSRSTNLIRLSLPSSLAMKWLIPALPNAGAINLKIALDVKEEAVDFQAKAADAAIRFGPGPYPGLHSTHLCHCWIQPVVSGNYPSHQDDHQRLIDNPKTPFLADLRGEADKTDFSWGYYFSKINSVKDDFNADYQFDRADLMLQAAISGLGVGLGRTLLIEADIEAGYLKTIGASVRMRSSYWLVCSSSFAESNRFKRLRAWLKSEIQATTVKAE
ncbi:MAG: LysR family glycine cleavage system transcriptional activator [Cellvibrionaceae bacterium]|jgi:LysR family glycine cleavage system transcriptional activator